MFIITKCLIIQFPKKNIIKLIWKGCVLESRLKKGNIVGRVCVGFRKDNSESEIDVIVHIKGTT